MKIDALKIDPTKDKLEGNVIPNTVVIDDNKLIYGEIFSAEVMHENDTLNLMGSETEGSVVSDNISDTVINGVSLDGKTVDETGVLLSQFFEEIEGLQI